MASHNLSIDLPSINFSCFEPSSITACSSSSSGHGRAIDRHSPHLRDPLREKYVRFRSQKSRKLAEPSPPQGPQPVSPAASSRYLLQDVSAIDADFSDAESFPSLRFECLKGVEDFAVMEPPSPPKKRDQVVILRVSLHCKGCERKVRKHISKMKGVTSFSTDITTKKVTVAGDVTPLNVLNSISKVKKAQFWPS